jgi:hypothetical protein
MIILSPGDTLDLFQMPLQQDRCLFYMERQVQPSETLQYSNPIQGVNQLNTVGPTGKFVGFFPISKQTPP